MKLLYNWVEVPNDAILLINCALDVTVGVLRILACFEWGDGPIVVDPRLDENEIAKAIRTKHNLNLLLSMIETTLVVLALYAFVIYMQKDSIAEPTQVVYYKVKRAFVLITIAFIVVFSLVFISLLPGMLVLFAWEWLKLDWMSQLIANAEQEAARRVQRLINENTGDVEMV